MASKSGIHIKPENRGKFTASSRAAGQSVQEHANSVLKPGSRASTKEKRRAVFARNAKQWAKNRRAGRKSSRSSGRR